MFSDDTRTDDEKRAAELIRELRSLHKKGKIPPENDFHSTVGSMIWRAREEKGVSRAQLAKTTGISQNSLAKYEKAGEEDGQYPPLPKMALLCKELNLDPRKVMLRTFYLDEAFLGRIEPNYFTFDEFLGTLDVDKRELEMTYQTLEGEVAESQYYREQCRKLEIEKKELEKQVKKLPLKPAKQNGPDQNDLSRPEISTTNSKAVSAASTKPTKGKSDDVA